MTQSETNERPVPQWLPIESAPKNGEQVLLYLDPPVDTNDIVGYATAKNLYVVVGWTTGTLYMDGSVEWVCGLCDEGSADTEGYSSPYMIEVHPTHWMPLPLPPVEERTND